MIMAPEIKMMKNDFMLEEKSGGNVNKVKNRDIAAPDKSEQIIEIKLKGLFI